MLGSSPIAPSTDKTRAVYSLQRFDGNVSNSQFLFFFSKIRNICLSLRWKLGFFFFFFFLQYWSLSFSSQQICKAHSCNWFLAPVTEAMEKLTETPNFLWLSFFLCRSAASREGALSGATQREVNLCHQKKRAINPPPSRSADVTLNPLQHTGPCSPKSGFILLFLRWSPAGLQTMSCVKESKYCREGVEGGRWRSS